MQSVEALRLAVGAHRCVSYSAQFCTLKPTHASKFFLVVGNQDQSRRECVRGNAEIVVADHFSLASSSARSIP
jgi:hypothetical protein